MSEFGIRAPEALIERVRVSENQFEESLREAFLADRLFHQAHLAQALENPAEYMDGLGRLQREFLEDKRNKNMGERFDLALSDKYLGKVHVIELGMTTDPGLSGEIDGLKDEYRDLLRWLVEHNIVDRELSREESHRILRARRPITPEAQSELVVMERNRPLIETKITHNDSDVLIGIAKRMVFSMPIKAVQALLHNERGLNDPRTLQIVENMLEHSSGGVKPIRTAYYLATEVIQP